MYADMAKLADALASGASRGNPVQVQVLLSALFFLKLFVKLFYGEFFVYTTDVR